MLSLSSATFCRCCQKHISQHWLITTYQLQSYSITHAAFISIWHAWVIGQHDQIGIYAVASMVSYINGEIQIGTHAVASMMSYINYEILCMHES